MRVFYLFLALIFAVGNSVYFLKERKLEARLEVLEVLPGNKVKFRLTNKGKALMYCVHRDYPPGVLEVLNKKKWRREFYGGSCGAGYSNLTLESNQNITFTQKPRIYEGKWRLRILLYEKEDIPQWLRKGLIKSGIKRQKVDLLELVSEEVDYNYSVYDKKPTLKVLNSPTTRIGIEREDK